MGIMGLEGFYTIFIRNGTTKINIINEIEKWKRDNPTETPIIIIDLSWMIFYMNIKYFDEAICGGRNQILLKFIETFLEKLRAAGAKLLFTERAFDTDNASNFYWDMDGDHMYTDDVNVLDIEKLKNGYNRISLAGMDVESLAEKHGEIINSYRKRFSQIINYTRKNSNLLAILAKDSNFLMHDLGRTRYWSCDQRFFKTVSSSTIEFSGTELNDFLRFSSRQKVLFQSILAASQSEFKEKRHFSFFNFENLRKTRFFNAIRENNLFLPFNSIAIALVASYIVKQFPDKEPINFAKIARDIFDAENSKSVEKLSKCYTYFMTPLTLDEYPEDLDNFHQRAKKYQFIYNVLVNRVICLPPHDFVYVDIKQWNGASKSYAELVLSIFKRNMGILLQHKADETLTCQIIACDYLLRADTKIFPQENETAIYPKIEVPDLNRLIFESDDNELRDLKWQLLFWTLSIDVININFGAFSEIRDELKPVVVTLLFLRKENQITEKEADTILIAELDSMTLTNSDRIPYPENLYGRIVRIVNLYVHIRKIINQTFRVCGLQKYAESVRLDGVHFHNLSEKYEKMHLLYNIALHRNSEIKKCRLYAD